MPEREKQADSDRLLALLHELAGDIVDGRDVIGIHGVPKAESIGHHGGPEQHRLPVKGYQRPGPHGHTERDQERIDDDDASPDRALNVLHDCLFALTSSAQTRLGP